MTTHDVIDTVLENRINELTDELARLSMRRREYPGQYESARDTLQRLSWRWEEVRNPYYMRQRNEGSLMRGITKDATMHIIIRILFDPLATDKEKVTLIKTTPSPVLLDILTDVINRIDTYSVNQFNKVVELILMADIDMSTYLNILSRNRNNNRGRLMYLRHQYNEKVRAQRESLNALKSVLPKVLVSKTIKPFVWASMVKKNRKKSRKAKRKSKSSKK